jgi:hypothetical protein
MGCTPLFYVLFYSRKKRAFSSWITLQENYYLFPPQLWKRYFIVHRLFYSRKIPHYFPSLLFGKILNYLSPLFPKKVTTFICWLPQDHPTGASYRHAKASYVSFIWDYNVLLQCFNSTFYITSEFFFGSFALLFS